MTKEDYSDYKLKLLLNGGDDSVNMYTAISYYFDRMGTKFSANNITAEQGLFLFHMFLAKYYDEDWDYRVVAGVSLYVTTKHKIPMTSYKYKDLIWKMLESDFQIKVAEEITKEEAPDDHNKLMKLHNNDRSMKKGLGTGFITIETKILEISDFELDFDVPYSFISNFHIKYKDVSERNYTKLYPNIVSGSNLEFNSIWDFFMQAIVKVLNDSYYHPYGLYHHPALIAFVGIGIAHSSIDQLYSVKLIFENTDDDPSPTQGIFKEFEFTDEQINEAKLDIDGMYEAASSNLTDFSKSN